MEERVEKFSHSLGGHLKCALTGLDLSKLRSNAKLESPRLPDVGTECGAEWRNVTFDPCWGHNRI